MVATRSDRAAPASPAAAPADKRPPHRWKFFRAGGVDQVMLRDGRDIVRLGELDQKLWVALAMPTRGVEMATRTLDLLDTDKDGRIRVPEILAAVKWVEETWRNPDDLLAGGDGVQVSALREGATADAVKRSLATVGKKDASMITIADARAAIDRFVALKMNGDGIVPAESTDDLEGRRAIEDIIATLGGLTDRSGKPGVDQAKVEAFFADVAAYTTWRARADEDPTLLPFGDDTPAVADALVAVRSKIEDWFLRCRLVAFEARAAASIGGTEADFTALAGKELSASSPEVSKLPLAHIEAGKMLPLREGLNPAWSAAMATFADKVVKPILGAKKGVADGDWAEILAKLAPYFAWKADEPATPAAKLGLGRLRELLAGGAKDKLIQLCKDDLARDEDAKRLESVEKLVLFQRDLYDVLNNFVNFASFYALEGALFQAGTLFLDGRSCELTFHVADPGKHAVMAGLSSSYLAYCDCTRPGGEKMTIAAAFTGGDSDNLMAGRNGIFYDRKGRDWDATVTKIVSNPISVRQAFFAPYKKFVRMLEEQFAKRAAAADADVHSKLDRAAEAAVHADKQPPPAEGAPAPAPAPPPAPAPAAPAAAKKIDVGTVAAIGVAIGGIGAMVAGLLASFFGLGAWMPIGVLALILMISGPSMMLAYLKLRQRNLGPILDANGWAINGRARVNVPFGGALTDLAVLPKGAERALRDPFADKRRPWKLYITLLLIVVLGVTWYVGRLDRYLPGPVKSVSVLGKYAPAAKAPEPAPAPVPAPAPAPAQAPVKP